MLFNAGGLQLMGWLTGSEIYPLAVRGAGTSAQSATLWGTNLLITLTLLPILEAIGAGATMWMYGIFNVIAWVFIYRRMPELTGHSLEQIEQQLHFGKFRPKDFADLREEGQFGLHYHPQSAQGLVEGINAKIRLINARGYGHHSAQTLTSMIYLCLGGLQVKLPTTT